MIDETNVRIEPHDHAGDDVRYGETLLYDFAKFVTTLSLIVLGAVLTLSGTSDGQKIKMEMLVFSGGTIAAGGIIAFSAANALVDARVRGRAPSRHLRKAMKGALLLIGMGVGSFLATWMDMLR